ncbi:MAG: hypothetical protein CMK07_12690 [Ponticaulis sp.]|nr:hypothetical protein [Ponticaulis sp.]
MWSNRLVSGALTEIFRFVLQLNELALKHMPANTHTLPEGAQVILLDSGGGNETALRTAVNTSTLDVYSLEDLFQLRDEVVSASTLLVLDCDELGEAELRTLRHLQDNKPCAVLVLARTGTPEAAQQALRNGASTCVIDGFQPHRFDALAAITRERFLQSSQLKQELEKAKNSLEARKIIDRAKGRLMDDRGLTEPEAYEMLRKTAMKQSRSIREIAESVLLVADIGS